jgi:hypothetical protein
MVGAHPEEENRKIAANEMGSSRETIDAQKGEHRGLAGDINALNETASRG